MPIRKAKPAVKNLIRNPKSRISSKTVFPNGKALATYSKSKNLASVKTKEGHIIKVAPAVMTLGAARAGLFYALWNYDVVSSNLKQIMYDPFRMEMRIRFLNESLYAYYDVPLDEFLGLMKASSHGHYFWEHMRDPGLPGSKQYKFEKVE